MGPGAVASGGELREAQRELASLRERFRSIIQKTADGIVVVDGSGVIRFANRSAGQLFGSTAEALLGRNFGHPLVDGETAEIEILRSGEVLVTELRVVGTEWEGQQASVVSLRDITDRRKAEERARQLLREQMARSRAEQAAQRASLLSEASHRLSSSLDFETTLGHVVDLVVEEFADFCVVDLVVGGEVTRRVAATGDDARAERLVDAARYPLDTESDTPQARVFTECEPLHVRDVSTEWLRQATRSPEHLEIAKDLQIRSLIFVPLYAGHDCLGVLTAGRWREDEPFDEQEFHFACDLGERAALAVENALLYEEAEAANRAKTNFLSVMSHELRTPLSAIIGYTDLMDRGHAGEVAEEQARYIGRIRASSNHLLQIIEEILAFASTEAGEEKVHPETTTLEDLLEGVLVVANPLAHESSLPFIVEVDQPDAELVTDIRKVRQILLNLVSNALKFTTEGEVGLHAEVAGDEVVFRVRDTGVGIPPERLENIFERFWQVENPLTRRAGGTGIGLAVAKGFAELLGGSLTVESSPGDGSEFTLRVPRRMDT